MMRSLFSGVAGLKTHQTKMDVIGNNISNVNTVAFKSSSTTFADIMYQTTSQASGATANRGGTNAKQIGRRRYRKHQLPRRWRSLRSGYDGVRRSDPYRQRVRGGSCW